MQHPSTVALAGEAVQLFELVKKSWKENENRRTPMKGAGDISELEMSQEMLAKEMDKWDLDGGRSDDGGARYQ